MKYKAIKVYKHRCWYQQGKVCYDKKGAITAANSRYRESHVKLRAYWCPSCNFWHLTKQFNNIMDEIIEETNEDKELEPETVSPQESPVEESPAQAPVEPTPEPQAEAAQV